MTKHKSFATYILSNFPELNVMMDEVDRGVCVIGRLYIDDTSSP
jgi:hypothetical protein